MKNDLSIGLGLRAQHYSDIIATRPNLSWFEAISENYMGIENGGGGRPLATLQKIREHYPIVLHGVSLSIGSTDPLNFDYLKRLKELISKIEPEWVSDHVCWTSVDGENMHDLLPLPYTEEALDHLSERILRAQDYLGRQLTFENVSAYLSFRHAEMSEWEFLTELVKRADCKLLLDVNNVYVSSVNQNFDPIKFLDAIPRESVQQMHLAGHSQGDNYLIDTHDGPVCDEVWNLYRYAVKHFPGTATLIEWDDKIPQLSRLLAEAETAKKIWEEAI